MSVHPLYRGKWTGQCLPSCLPAGKAHPVQDCGPARLRLTRLARCPPMDTSRQWPGGTALRASMTRWPCVCWQSHRRRKSWRRGSMKRTTGSGLPAVVPQWMSGVPRFHLSSLGKPCQAEAEAGVLCPEFEHQRSWSQWWPSTLVDCPTFKSRLSWWESRPAIPRMPKQRRVGLASWTAGSICHPAPY